MFSEVETSIDDLGIVNDINIFEDLGNGTEFSAGIQNNNVLNQFILNDSAIDNLNQDDDFFIIGGNNESAGDAFGYDRGVESDNQYKLVIEVADSSNKIPEPSTLAIFALSLIGISLRARNK